MLTKEDNELITRVGPETQGGALLRRFWYPVLKAAALEPDGAPKKVRLLGENFVAFRAGDGRVGMVEELCPHRRASLVLARNEECGLRCLFHGWKLDLASGSCLGESARVRTYDVQVINGRVLVACGIAS